MRVWPPLINFSRRVRLRARFLHTRNIRGVIACERHKIELRDGFVHIAGTVFAGRLGAVIRTCSPRESTKKRRKNGGRASNIRGATRRGRRPK
jgi:hypothetical protein